MSRVRSQSVNDIYDGRFAADSGNHDDIYESVSDLSRDLDDDERSFESESDTASVRDSIRMPPPPSKSAAEMALRKLEKNELITKYLELDKTERELRIHNRGIIIDNRNLYDNIQTLLEDMRKQDATIDVLKMGKRTLEQEKTELQSKYDGLKMERDTLQREKTELHSKYELLKARVSDLTGKKSIQGGSPRSLKNKRIKYVSKRSTASRHHATRRHSSRR